MAVVFGFVVPFLTIIICYSRLIHRLRATPDPEGNAPAGDGRDGRHHNRARGSRLNNKRRSVHMVTMVTATFLLCFLPYHVIRSLHLHAVCSGWSCATIVTLQRTVVVTLCLAASNSVVNPLLYYYSTRAFRENMKDAQTSLMSSRRSSFKPDLAMTKRRSTN